ncbi:MAG: hypothetical protein IKE24_09160 [Clostridia bacterium]|nr:hypothetical protein [Clostridia bacterium]
MKKRSGWVLNTLLYGLWLLFILGAALYADFYDAELHRLTGRMWMLVLLVALGAPFLLKKVRDWVPGSIGWGSRLSPLAFRGICLACSLLVLGFCFLAVCPGGFDGDPVKQLRQAVSGQYNDFFPALHTLIAFRLPLALTGGWYPSVILFQILLFSLALTWVCDTVRIASDAFRGFIALAVILLNPITQSYLMYGYKDETFGICAMALVCMNARILFSRGAWLKKPLHLALFSVMLAVTSIIRHNGFLFAIPCLLGAALCVSPKRTLAAAGAAVAVFIGIKGPLYSALGVEKAEDRSSQTMGLPMAVIGGPVTYRPEKLESDVLDFAYGVAPEEVWQEKYTWGVFNWVDWDERSNHEALAEAGMGGALKIMLRAFAEAPKESLKALIETTKIAYTVVPDQLADGAVYLAGEDLGLTDQGIPWMRSVMDGYRRMMYIIAPHSFLHSGVTLLILLTVILGRWPLNRKESWLRILPVLSVFCYNLVTMLVLFSWWDGARFFHYSLWVLPVLLVMLTRNGPSEAVEEAKGA